MELRFPAYNLIKQVEDIKRPGFMFLDFSQACCDTMIANHLANNKGRILSQSKLRRWIDSIFTNALYNYGNVVHGIYEDYQLKYVWRGAAYTIQAVSHLRTFSIDFVPAVKIVCQTAGTWHAIPKSSNIAGHMHRYTFMISNVDAELQHVARCGRKLKDVLRLLQAFRISKNLPKLRCTHFVNLAIWLSTRMGYQTLYYMSVSDLFLQMLYELCEAFYEGHLPYIWNCQMNLLGNFKEMEILQYHNELLDAYTTLDSYPSQPALSYARCLSHFE
ncbi:uncharacterized protein LOC108654765 [Drosophila navojoa]|nr:uncharacterized protein LOC108654765 [Drosophila navojoa]